MDNKVTDYDYFIDVIFEKIGEKREVKISSRKLQFEAIREMCELKDNCGRYVLDINDLFVIGMAFEGKGHSFNIWEDEFEDGRMNYIIQLILN